MNTSITSSELTEILNHISITDILYYYGYRVINKEESSYYLKYSSPNSSINIYYFQTQKNGYNNLELEKVILSSTQTIYSKTELLAHLEPRIYRKYNFDKYLEIIKEIKNTNFPLINKTLKPIDYKNVKIKIIGAKSKYKHGYNINHNFPDLYLKSNKECLLIKTSEFTINKEILIIKEDVVENLLLKYNGLPDNQYLFVNLLESTEIKYDNTDVIFLPYQTLINKNLYEDHKVIHTLIMFSKLNISTIDKLISNIPLQKYSIYYFKTFEKYETFNISTLRLFLSFINELQRNLNIQFDYNTDLDIIEISIIQNVSDSNQFRILDLYYSQYQSKFESLFNDPNYDSISKPINSLFPIYHKITRNDRIISHFYFPPKEKVINSIMCYFHASFSLSKFNIHIKDPIIKESFFINSKNVRFD